MPPPIDKNQKKQLLSLVRFRKTLQKVPLRARIVRLASEDTANNAVTSHLGIGRPTVLLWRADYPILSTELLSIHSDRNRHAALSVSGTK